MERYKRMILFDLLCEIPQGLVHGSSLRAVMCPKPCCDGITLELAFYRIGDFWGELLIVSYLEGDHGPSHDDAANGIKNVLAYLQGKCLQNILGESEMIPKIGQGLPRPLLKPIFGWLTSQQFLFDVDDPLSKWSYAREKGQTNGLYSNSI